MRAASRWWRVAGYGLLVALAAALVTTAYLHFLEDPDALFTGLAHDRHTHYRAAQRLATDLRAGDPVAFLHDVERERTWPPLHALLAAGPVALAGVDFRAAPLVSAAGWLLSLVFAFVAAKRAAPAYGDLAGLLAALFVAGSPSHRRFATDVMLESLGAALTLAALTCFVGWLRDRDARDARAFAIVLSAILLLKYNYYLLALASFGAAAVTVAWAGAGAGPGAGGQAVRVARLLPAAASLVGRCLRDPAGWAVVVLLALAGGVAVTGGGRFEVMGHSVSVTHPSNVVHLAYGVGLVRIAVWWALGGRRRIDELPDDLRAFVHWHAAVLAVWLALPRRLGYFAAHLAGPEGVPAPSRWLLYARSFVRDFHAEATAVPCAALAILLLAFAVARWRRLAPPARGTLVFAATAAALTLLHPSAESRFLHSWIAALWVAASVGAAALLLWVSARVPALSSTSATAIVAVLVLALPLAGAVAGALQPPGPASAPARRVLPLADLLFPPAVTEGRVAVAASTPAEEFFEWVVVERGGSRERIRLFTPRSRSSADERRREFQTWREGAEDACVLLLEVPPGSPLHVPGHPAYDELRGFFRDGAGAAPGRRLEPWGVTLWSESCPAAACAEAGVSTR